MSSILKPNISPSIIDKELLERCILEQVPPGDVGKLLAVDGVRFDLVQVLRLDFLNIIKIDFLWPFTSLTKLSLAHNGIDAIQNLDELLELKELDLSFNRIAEIENLHSNVKLEVLMLNNNQIKELKNLDSLIKLTVLSISGNNINDYQQIAYLRKFPNLKTISFKDNPCCDEDDCYSFLKAILPQVIYLNYAMIGPEDKFRCSQQFRQIIKLLDEEEKIAKDAKRAAEENESLNKFYKKAFVENFSSTELFDIMFKSDSDGYVLLNAGDELKLLHKKYKLEYADLITNFLEFNLAQYYLREEDIVEFKQSIAEARKKSTEKSRKDIDGFLMKTYKVAEENSSDKIKFQISLVMDSIDIGENAEKDVYINILWKSLMMDEIITYEQCQKTRLMFLNNMESRIDSVIEESHRTFDSWRDKENEWIIKLEKYFADLIESSLSTPPEISYLLSEPEVLMDIIKLSKENHLQFINYQEESFNKKMNNWMQNFRKQILSEEIEKNRSRVLEISQLVEKL